MNNPEKIQAIGRVSNDPQGTSVTLQLSRETIQELTGAELAAVWGGIVIPPKDSDNSNALSGV